MKTMLVTLTDKARLPEVEELGKVTHVFKFLNLISMEVEEENISLLQEHPAVDCAREPEQGFYIS